MTCWRCGDPSDEPTCVACVASFDRLLAEIVDRWGTPEAKAERAQATPATCTPTPEEAPWTPPPTRPSRRSPRR